MAAIQLLEKEVRETLFFPIQHPQPQRLQPAISCRQVDSSPRRKRSHPLPAHSPRDFKASSSRLTLPVPMIRALPSCQRDEIDIPPLIPSSCVPLGIQAAWRFPRVNRVRADCPCCFGHLGCWKVIWGRARYDDVEGIEARWRGFLGVYHEGVKYCCCYYDGGNLSHHEDYGLLNITIEYESPFWLRY